MKNILSELKESWFSPMPAERLSILRIATGFFALWYLLTRFDMMADMAGSETSLYEPVGLAHLLSQPMFPALFTGLLASTVALNIAYIFGWKFRWTGPLFALTLLFVFSYRNSWSMVYHNYIALVLHVLVVGFVASADRISLDHRKRQKSGSETASSGWQYGWPIKLICAATVLTYFLSGAAKILSVGLDQRRCDAVTSGGGCVTQTDARRTARADVRMALSAHVAVFVHGPHHDGS